MPCTLPLRGAYNRRVAAAQVLVYHDLLGMMQHPHHAKVTPKFCKQYAAVGQVRPCRAPKPMTKRRPMHSALRKVAKGNGHWVVMALYMQH